MITADEARESSKKFHEKGVEEVFSAIKYAADEKGVYCLQSSDKNWSIIKNEVRSALQNDSFFRNKVIAALEQNDFVISVTDSHDIDKNINPYVISISWDTPEVGYFA